MGENVGNFGVPSSSARRRRKLTSLGKGTLWPFTAARNNQKHSTCVITWLWACQRKVRVKYFLGKIGKMQNLGKFDAPFPRNRTSYRKTGRGGKLRGPCTTMFSEQYLSEVCPLGSLL